MSKKLIVLEDIYDKLEELIALCRHIASEQPYIGSDASDTKAMLEELANHLGLSTKDCHEDEADPREHSRGPAQ